MVRGDEGTGYCQTKCRREVVAREGDNWLTKSADKELKRLLGRVQLGASEWIYLVLAALPFPAEGGFIAIYAELVRLAISEDI